MMKKQLVGLGRTAEIFTWNEKQVLKLFHAGCSLSAVEWEENIAKTVSSTGLPVPAVYDIIEVDSRYGIIYERIVGPSMLEELVSKPNQIEYFADMFANLHAQMHFLEIRELPSQRQQIEKKIKNAKPLLEDERKKALKTLGGLPDDEVVCHGDFHPDNIIMSTHGPIVIDWNDATKGNPHADIARTLLLLQQGEITQPLEIDKEQIQSIRNSFIQSYLRSYTQIQHISIEDIESWRLPITAARLSEGIKEEENRLLSIVDTLLEHTK